MIQEVVQPLLFVWNYVLTDVEVLDLLAVLTNSFHKVSQLTSMNVNSLEVQLLDLWYVPDHALERIHQNELIDHYI